MTSNKAITVIEISEQKPDWVTSWKDESAKWYFSSGATVNENKEVTGLVPCLQTELRTVMHKTDRFNAVLENKSKKRDEIEASLNESWIIPRRYNFNEAVTRIRSCFRSADACALDLQKRSRLLIQIFFFSILMTIVGYECFNNFGPDAGDKGYYSLLLFLIAIMLITGINLFSRKVEYKRKFHDFRAYAELMRISSYLSYLGLNRKIIELFSPETRSITAWLEHARRSAEYKTWSKEYASSEDKFKKINNVKEWWIDDQLTYFSNKKDLNKNKYIGYISKIFYLFGMAMTTYIAFYYFKGEVTVTEYFWMNVIFFGVSGAIVKWGELQGYEEDKGRYTLAYDMYHWSELEFDQLKKKNDISGLENLLIELAKQAIAENTRWYITHTARDVRII